MIQKRIEQHQKARELMDNGFFSSASELIINALYDFGPHVGLLSDLASAAYLAGQMDLFVQTTKELQSQFQTHHAHLSDKSYMRTCLALGKLLEETGQVAEALSLYESALVDRKIFQLSQLEFCQKVQIQILRLKSYLGIRSKLAELYQQCVQASSTNVDLQIEIEHGLMLAEIQLFGLDAAKERYASLQQKTEKSTDVRLAYFDLAEEMLRLEQEPPKLSFVLTELDYFEKILFFMASSPDFAMSIRDLQKIQNKMSPLCYLRICILNLSRNAHPEVRKQVLFLLESLSSESRQLLKRKWAVELGTAKSNILLKLETTSLGLGGHSMPLIAEGFEHRCLQILSKHRALTTDEMIQLAYHIIPDEFAHERLRIAILRLNKKMVQLTGLPKVIQQTKLKISLHPEVSIRS